MIKATSILTLVLLVSTTVLGSDAEPYFKSAPMPFYPPLARQARIEGEVSLRFAVNEQGDTTEIEAVTGPQMLRQAAVQSIQGWKFGWPHPCACLVKRQAVFFYRLSDELESVDKPSVTVRWFGKMSVIRVEIESYNPHWQP